MAWNVSIQKVVDIQPIPDADKIELAYVLGWQCVVLKDLFKPGDLGVYIPIDSIVPPTETFEFMKDRKYRVTTIKLRKQLSQGLLLPLSILPEGTKVKEGMEVQDILGITKYEKPVPGSPGNPPGTRWAKYRAKMSLRWPSFLRKSDEERIQNMPWILKDTETRWEKTEKLNGSSCTVYWYNQQFSLLKRIIAYFKVCLFGRTFANIRNGVCSRNVDLEPPGSKKKNFNQFIPVDSFWEVVIRDSILSKLETFCMETGRNLALQGELLGPGVQGNYYHLPQHDIYFYKVWDIDQQIFLPPEEAHRIVMILGLKYVPTMMDLCLTTYFKDLNEILAHSDGMSLIANVPREGFVYKDLKDGNRSFKVVSNKYLLKQGE